MPRRNLPQPPTGRRQSAARTQRAVQQGGQRATRRQRRQAAQSTGSSGGSSSSSGSSGYYEFDQPQGQQLAGSYADTLMGGATESLPSLFRQFGQQGNQANLYAGAAGDTLGQYRNLMGGNQAIQENLARQIQAIQSGADTGYDPLLDQQLGQEQGVLEEQMRRQLGPDWQNSSAGMEALGRFNQRATTMRQSSRFNQLQGLLNQQQQGMGNLAGQGVNLGGLYGRQAGQLYEQGLGFGQEGQAALGGNINRAANMLSLYGQVPQTLADFGYNMSNQAQNAVGAQNPYQQDRFAQLRSDTVNPSDQTYRGQMMGQSGDRWTQFGQGMTGVGMQMQNNETQRQNAQAMAGAWGRGGGWGGG